MPIILSKLVKKQSPKADEPPTLPQNRPRVLTPSASRESLFASSASATTKSAFFQKLPFEIRHMILRHAFGDKIMGMCLCFDYPLKPLRKLQPYQRVKHFSIRSLSLELRWRVERAREERWQWYSYICHPWTIHFLFWWRIARTEKEQWLWYSYMHHQSPPAIMNTYGDEDICDDDSLSTSTYLGVMGWLLSCRQALVLHFILILSVGLVIGCSEILKDTLKSTDSFHTTSYAECIDILYATNALHMSGNSYFLQHLPNVFLPQRLASITSVNITWVIDPFNSVPDQTTIYGLPAFDNFLTSIPTILPHLKRLHISLEGVMAFASEALQDELPEIFERNIWMSIDHMISKLSPHIQTCCIAIPASVYTTLKFHIKEATEQESPQNRSVKARVWRELPTSDSISLHPSANLSGYWICIGQLDVPLETMLSLGFHIRPKIYDSLHSVFET